MDAGHLARRSRRNLLIKYDLSLIFSFSIIVIERNIYDFSSVKGH
jgi:hypothetical protein